MTLLCVDGLSRWMLRASVVAVLLLGVNLPGAHAADSARLLPYSGRLELNGAPVGAPTPFVFQLFAADTGGTALWTETQTLAVSSGLFTAVLGSVTPLPAAVVETPELFLAVTVNGTLLATRQRIYAAPAALKSDSGSVGIGSIIGHTVGGQATSIAEMQRRGFALCDGTTPASQGVENAVLTGATPDLNTTGRFLRGSTTGGAFQDQATAVNGLSASITDPGHDHMTMTTDNCGNFNGGFSVGGLTFRNVAVEGAKRSHNWDLNVNCSSGQYTTAARATGVLAALSSSQPETRPTNMGVVWMMRVR